MNLNRIEKVIEFFAIVFMTIILAIFIRALIAGDTKGEANTGDFGSSTFNEGWRMEGDDPDGSITLPADVAAPRNEMIVIRNILPDDISDGMIMLFRTSIEDIYDFLNANKEMHSEIMRSA